MAESETTDSVSKKIILRDEDGERIVTLKMTVEFTELFEDSGIEKIPEFFEVTAKSFELMMDR